MGTCGCLFCFQVGPQKRDTTGANSLLCDPAKNRGVRMAITLPPAIMVQWKNGMSPRFSFLSIV